MFLEVLDNMALFCINKAEIKAIVFDFDGTLAKLNIDFQQMREVVFDLISSYGITGNDVPTTYVLEMIYAAAEILEKKSDKNAQLLISNALHMIENLEIHAANRGELFFYTRYLLRKLADYGILTGIITRNCSAAIKIVFPDIEEYCTAIICRDQVTNVKPHPDHLNKMLEILGTSAGNTLMVGDHPLDIQTGKAAGTYTAGVLTGVFQKKDFRQTEADIILSQATDLLNLIRQ